MYRLKWQFDKPFSYVWERLQTINLLKRKPTTKNKFNETNILTRLYDSGHPVFTQSLVTKISQHQGHLLLLFVFIRKSD